ncbi:MAG TPA: hypothetical protein VH720_12020 [Candidatus Limnocylindrales bacterium]
MHRRPLGRGRTLAAAGALIILVGCVLPWWRLGGADGIPPIGGNAFEGSGIVVFLIAAATLALLTLPYAAGDRPLEIRWLAYLLLVLAGWIGLGLRVLDFILDEPNAIFPDRAPGLWLAAAGLVVLSRAVYDMAHEPLRR